MYRKYQKRKAIAAAIAEERNAKDGPLKLDALSLQLIFLVLMYFVIFLNVSWFLYEKQISKLPIIVFEKMNNLDEHIMSFHF